jgi:hypothetical protein
VPSRGLQRLRRAHRRERSLRGPWPCCTKGNEVKSEKKAKQKTDRFSVKLTSTGLGKGSTKVVKNKGLRGRPLELQFAINVTTFGFELGATVRDQVSGFKGVVTGRAQYLTGEAQYCVQPSATIDGGSIVDGRWYDEGRLEQVAEVPVLKLVSDRGVRVRRPRKASRA